MSAGFVFLSGGCGLNGAFGDGLELGAISGEGIECTGFDEGFDGGFGEEFGIDAFGEVEDIFEGSFGIAFFDECFDGGFTDSADSGESEGNFSIEDPEVDFGAIDIGREDFDFHASGIIDVFADAFGALHFAAEEGGHEFDGVVCFEKGGFPGDESVGGGVGFVEAVSGEGDDEVPEFLGDLFGDAVADGAGDVVGVEPGDHFFLFFADGFNAFVGFAEFDVTDAVEDPHDLFLVHHNTVGFFEYGVDGGVYFAGWFSAVFNIDVFHDHAAFERAWSVEGGGGDDIGEAVGLHFGEEVAHASGFKLEDSFGFAALEELEGALIGEIGFDVFEVEIGVAAFNVLNSFIEDGEVSEPEEVHLEEADFFDGRSIPLRDDVFLAGDGLEWEYGIERNIGDHDAGGVGPGAAGESFDGHGEVEEFAGDGIAFPCGFEFCAFADGVLESDIESFGDHFREFVDSRERHIESASDIADGIFGFECAIGSDLGDVSFAVFFLGVVDDHLPAVAAEVDIDIGGFVSTGVEEAFEEEVVFEGADISESQQVGHNCAAGGAAGAAGDAISAGEFDEVPDDEEVAGVAFGFDDAEFVFETFPVGIGEFVVIAFVHAFAAQIPQVLDVCLPIGRSEDRIEFSVTELEIDAVSDFLGPGDGIFKSRKTLIHFPWRADMESVMFHFHAFFVIDGRACIDAEHDVLDFGIVLCEVVGIVGCNEG
ncbi:MAG: hypothetical protein RL215_1391 [Planctomycetota bacterium]